MLIRGQKKNVLIQMQDLSIKPMGTLSMVVRVKDPLEVYKPNDILKITIGTYSSKEKAMKVLDMIQDCYANFSKRYGTDRSDYAVFQMPQDEEVQA